MKPKFQPNIDLGNIVQILTILLTVTAAVWHLGGQQQQLFEQNRQVFDRLQKDEAEISTLESDYVRKDVQLEASKVMEEKLDFISADIQTIKAKIGLSAQKWQNWR